MHRREKIYQVFSNSIYFFEVKDYLYTETI